MMQTPLQHHPKCPACPAWTPAGTEARAAQGSRCVLTQLYSLDSLLFEIIKPASLKLPLLVLILPPRTPGKGLVSFLQASQEAPTSSLKKRSSDPSKYSFLILPYSGPWRCTRVCQRPLKA